MIPDLRRKLRHHVQSLAGRALVAVEPYLLTRLQGFQRLEAQLAEVAAERNALRAEVEADGAELTPRLCAGCDDRNRIAQTLAQALAERDQAQRDLREARGVIDAQAQALGRQPGGGA